MEEVFLLSDEGIPLAKTMIGYDSKLLLSGNKLQDMLASFFPLSSTRHNLQICSPLLLPEARCIIQRKFSL